MEIALLSAEVLALGSIIQQNSAVSKVSEEKERSTRARRRLSQQGEEQDARQDCQYVKNLITELAEQHKEKWEFDFIKQKPICQTEFKFEYQEVPLLTISSFQTTTNCSPLKSSCDDEKTHLSFVDSSYCTDEDMPKCEKEFSHPSQYLWYDKDLSPNQQIDENVHPLFSTPQHNQFLMKSTPIHPETNVKFETPRRSRITKQLLLTDFMRVRKFTSTKKSMRKLVNSPVKEENHGILHRIEGKIRKAKMSSRSRNNPINKVIETTGVISENCHT